MRPKIARRLHRFRTALLSRCSSEAGVDPTTESVIITGLTPRTMRGRPAQSQKLNRSYHSTAESLGVHAPLCRGTHEIKLTQPLPAQGDSNSEIMHG